MNTDPRIDQAIGRMHAAAWDDATSILEEVLAEAPHEPHALRLLGTVHFVNGRLEPATQLLEASVEADPGAVSTWVNLASVHLAAGQQERALGAAERAVALDEQSTDALFNLGVALQGLGRMSEAEQAYARVLNVDPASLDARMNLAALAVAAGKMRCAVTLAEQVIAGDSNHLQARLCAARALTFIGNMDLAGAHLDVAERIEPDSEAVAGQRAEWLIVLGRLPEAELLLRKLLAAAPTVASLWTRLARVLMETGRAEEAAEHLAEAARLFPEADDVALQRAQALDSTGRREQALASVEEVIERTPHSASGHQLRGALLIDADRLVEADAAFARAVELAPNIVHGHHGRVRVALARRAPEQALELCNGYLARHPSERTLLAAKALVLRELGEADAARSLLDLDGLVSISSIEPPAGFASLGAFNEALESHVRAHPSLVESPHSHATRHGHHTGNLIVGDRGPFAAFERIVWNAFSHYMKRAVAHPYLQHPPGLERLLCWAVLMRRAGHQTAHIHPAAWLSGVYYVRVPDAVTHGDATEGWIEFGEPPDNLYRLTREQPHRLVRPEPGMLVLFPSFLYHRTVPYQSNEERLSVAFDILPRVADPG